MAYNHASVINAEQQASWLERHLKNENGTKLCAQFIFDAGTRAQLKRIACHKGCSVTSLIKSGRRALSAGSLLALGQGAKAILRWRIEESSPISAVIRYNQNN
jgi:hypothetical protein